MRVHAETSGCPPAPARTDRDAGAERWRRIMVSTAGSAGARVVALLCTLATVPIALRYLGAAEFGAWAMLTSAINMLSCLDCGVGVGLQNRISGMMGRGRLADAARCLRSTFLVLVLISVGVAVLLGVALLTTGLPSLLLGRTQLPLSEQRAVVAIVAGGFALSMPLSLFSRVAMGLQQGWIANLAATAGTVVTLIGVVLAARLRLSFTAFVALSVVPLFATQLAAYFLVRRRLPGGLPLAGPCSLAEGGRTLREGSRYVLPQVGGLVMTQSPLLLLGAASSPVSAAVFAVFVRISMPFQQLQQLFLAQVWPAITEAMHRGDHEWLHRATRRLLRGGVVYGALAFVGTLAGVIILFPLLTRGATPRPTPGLVALYSAHVAVASAVQALAYVANGLLRVRNQNLFAALSIVCAATVLPVAASRQGIDGVLVVLLSLNALVAAPLLYRDYASYWSGVRLPRTAAAPAGA